MQQQPVSDDGESDDGSNTDAVTDTTDLPSPMEIGVTPPKTAQDEAGMVEGWYNTCITHVWTTDISLLFGIPALQGRRSTIQTYLQEIQESVKEIGDGGILDHTIAKLLPVVTTLRTHLDPSPEQRDLVCKSFDVTDKFAPAQKNETQPRFEKVKSKAKKTKVSFE